MTCHSERIKELNDRAKRCERVINDLNIGESCYLLSLIRAITDYYNEVITKEQLGKEQRILQQQLEQYYQFSEIFEYHIQINNRFSHVMTEAEKDGCPICKKLVRIFDGRETH